MISYSTCRRLAPCRTKSEPEDGFTLIELLVVVVILGILIAIAIPVYLNYRRTANDKASQSDTRGVITMLEQCAADNAGYPAATTFTLGATAGASGTVCINKTGFVSTGTTMTYFPISASDLSGYIVSATNAGGSGKIYCYSTVGGGGIRATSTAVTSYRAAC